MDRNGSGDANIAAVASLLADPARATIMIALSDGRALPAGELARLAHVAPSTASSHLSKLAEGGLIEVESWGRHRYYRVAGLEIVRAIEALSLISPAKPVRSLRHSWEAEAVRFARTCYDHLAGFLGVKFTRSLVELDVVSALEDGYEVTEAGHLHLLKFGVDLSGARSGCGSRPPTSTGASVTATSPRMPVTTKVPVPIAKVPEGKTGMRKVTTRHGRAPARQSPGPSGLRLRQLH